MSKHRQAAKVDANQSGIVKSLRAINGVTVELDKDDIFVGYNKTNYWFELKEPGNVSKKTGKIRDSAIKPSQRKLRSEWQGHYSIVWNLDQILTEMGLINDGL